MPAAANATPSGKLTRETWETIRDKIVDAAKKAGKLDGVCLSLHGAMVTETEDDAEGALLEALRGVVGPDVPIAATLDLHANATVRMAKNANALVSYRTYPHIDGYERAVQAAALVQEAMAGRKKPRCLLVQPAMLEGAEHGRTTQPGVMRDLLAKADAYEKEPGINVVSIQAGFTWADIPYTGPSIAVSHEPAAEARASEIARELIDEIWRRRDEMGGRPTIARSPTASPRRAPRSDKTGPLVHRRRHRQSGRRRLQRHHAGAAGAARCRHRERGVRHDLRSGARCSRRSRRASAPRSRSSWAATPTQSMGAPVKAKAIVKMLSDGMFKNDGPMNAGVETIMGPTAVLRIGGIDVVTISNRIQTIDLQVFLSQGIDPAAKSVLVVKSVQHFRAAYAPIAREIVLVDSGGICSPDICAAEIHQAAPADLAARRRQRSLRRNLKRASSVPSSRRNRGVNLTTQRLMRYGVRAALAVVVVAGAVYFFDRSGDCEPGDDCR